MNQEEFLRLYKKAAEKYHPSAQSFQKGEIRFLSESGGKFCPVTLVCFDQCSVDWSAGDYVEAAEELGLEDDLAYYIVASADNEKDETFFSEELRFKLLAPIKDRLS